MEYMPIIVIAAIIAWPRQHALFILGSTTLLVKFLENIYRVTTPTLNIRVVV